MLNILTDLVKMLKSIEIENIALKQQKYFVNYISSIISSHFYGKIQNG